MGIAKYNDTFRRIAAHSAALQKMMSLNLAILCNIAPAAQPPAGPAARWPAAVLTGGGLLVSGPDFSRAEYAAQEIFSFARHIGTAEAAP